MENVFCKPIITDMPLSSVALNQSLKGSKLALGILSDQRFPANAAFPTRAYSSIQIPTITAIPTRA